MCTLEVQSPKSRCWQSCALLICSTLSPSFWCCSHPWHFSACGGITSISASVITWPSSLCVSLLFFFFFFLKFIYFWLCWVFVSVRGLSPVAASGGLSSSRCAGLSLSWPLPSRSTSSRHASSVVVAHGLCVMLRGMWESSQTRARTRVPCIGRQILNHCATREALSALLIRTPVMVD